MAHELTVYEHNSGRAKPDEAHSNASDNDGRIRGAPSLKLYIPTITSQDSPMCRFMAMSPTQDAHAWMAKRAMEESGIGYGDLEALDLRMLASEMVDKDMQFQISPE